MNRLCIAICVTLWVEPFHILFLFYYSSFLPLWQHLQKKKKQAFSLIQRLDSYQTMCVPMGLNGKPSTVPIGTRMTPWPNSFLSLSSNTKINEIKTAIHPFKSGRSSGKSGMMDPRRLLGVSGIMACVLSGSRLVLLDLSSVRWSSSVCTDLLDVCWDNSTSSILKKQNKKLKKKRKQKINFLM